MSTMIALIGEQPLPNLLPIRHFHPQNVLFVYTERTEQVYRRLKATLQQETTVSGLKTDAFNMVTIAEALDKQLEQLSERNSLPIDFNLTGGTKAMALAAYQVAQQHDMPVFYLQSEGQHNRIYHYTWKSGQLRASHNILLPECVTLRDVFNVHFGPNEWQESGPGRLEGSPFEILLAKTLQSHGYEIMIGVRAFDGQIDIDVAIRFENRYGIIEAKMGNNGKKLDGIKQLSNNVRHVGTYTQTFFAVTVPPQRSHEAVMIASRIKVISLPSYDVNTNSLASDDLKKLVSIVDISLK